MILQQLSYHFFPQYQWPVPLAYLVYVVFYANFMIKIVARCGQLALKYGTLDEKVSKVSSLASLLRRLI